MIPKDKAFNLTAMYLYICDIYGHELQYHCQRFSNNKNPEFTDQEIMTIYLFVMAYEKRFKVKQIYQFAQDYLLSWFPKLPSYVAFVNRLNNLSEAFKILVISSIPIISKGHELSVVSVLDSVPIITCSGKRNGKVARDITDKTFSATKSMWYFGLKMHFLGFFRAGKLPLPESIVLTQASENDLNVFKQNWSNIVNRLFYGDKIYFDPLYFEQLRKTNNSTMYIPVKGIKNNPDCIKQWDRAADDLFSQAVSRIRQPVESFFNWLQEKTEIQNASKVRSTKGLLVHIFGRLAAAFLFLVFNS
jgi:hypothetical protein